MSSLNPVMPDRPAADGSADDPSAAPSEAEASAPRPADAGARCACRTPRAMIDALSAPALRRPAAARGHRHGADGRAVAAGDGRADHGPRRDGRGGGARSRARAAPEAQLGHRLHQPQSRHRRADLRPHRRDVCRRAGGGGADQLGVPQPAPSLYARPARLHPVLGTDKHSAPLVPIPGPGAAGAEPAGRAASSRRAASFAEPVRCTSGRIADRRRARRAGHRVQCVRAERAAAATERPQGAVAQAVASAARPTSRARDRRSAQDSITSRPACSAAAAATTCKALQRHQHVGAARHDAGHRRRIRLRQVHPRQGADRPREGDRRQRARSTAWISARSPVESRPQRSSASCRWCSRTRTARSTPATPSAITIERALRRLKRIEGSAMRDRGAAADGDRQAARRIS